MTEEAITDDTVQEFRQAMRNFAASVTIVTTEVGGARFGMTATAVTSVSMAPPTMLACVNQGASFHKRIVAKGAFCVNLLGSSHIEECRAFGGGPSPAERFSAGEWENGPHSLPFLSDAEAAIFCLVDRAIDHGTHTIFIGQVEHVLVKDSGRPLIYLDGGFVTQLCDGRA